MCLDNAQARPKHGGSGLFVSQYDYIMRFWCLGAGKSELQSYGELEDGVEVEVVGEFEEVVAFVAQGGFKLGAGECFPGVGALVFVLKIALTGGAEVAAAHVVEAQVECVVEGVGGVDGAGVADADVGLQLVPLAAAGESAVLVIVELEVHAAEVDGTVAAGLAVEAGAVAHIAFAEGEAGGDVEVAAEGMDIEEETGIIAIELDACAGRTPVFGGVVADGGAAQSESEVGIETVTQADAESLSAGGEGSGAGARGGKVGGIGIGD